MDIQISCKAKDITAITAALRLFVERGLLDNLSSDDQVTLSRGLVAARGFAVQATEQVTAKTAEIHKEIEAIKASMA